MISEGVSPLQACALQLRNHAAYIVHVFAARQTINCCSKTTIKQTGLCTFGSLYITVRCYIFRPHAGVYVAIPCTCKCIIYYGVPDTKVQHHKHYTQRTSHLSCDRTNCAYTFSCIHVGTRQYYGIVLICPSAICGHFEHCNSIPDFLTVAIILAGYHCCLTG